MTRIPGWGTRHLILMLNALNWFKPTTIDDWHAHADARAAILNDDFFTEEDTTGQRKSRLAKDARVDVVLEKAPARFLQRVFDAAIAAPDKEGARTFLPGESTIVIELEAILKKAVEVVEEKKPAATAPAPAPEPQAGAAARSNP